MTAHSCAMGALSLVGGCVGGSTLKSAEHHPTLPTNGTAPGDPLDPDAPYPVGTGVAGWGSPPLRLDFAQLGYRR